MSSLSLPIKIAIAVITCLVIGFLSGMSTTDSIANWYVHLNKPSFNPPNWIFGPAWSLLYTLMGIAAGIIWHEGLGRPEVKSAMYIFGAQLILNALWSLLFFNMQNPTFALVEIIILWLMILLTIVKFKNIKPIAGYLLIPYILWVTFATILNISIVMLN